MKKQHWPLLFLLMFGCGGENASTISLSAADLVGTWEGTAVISQDSGERIVEINLQFEKAVDETPLEVVGNFSMTPCLSPGGLRGRIEGTRLSFKVHPLLTENLTPEQIDALRSNQVIGAFEGIVNLQNNVVDGSFTITASGVAPQECKISGRWRAARTPSGIPS